MRIPFLALIRQALDNLASNCKRTGRSPKNLSDKRKQKLAPEKIYRCQKVRPQLPFQKLGLRKVELCQKKGMLSGKNPAKKRTAVPPTRHKIRNEKSAERGSLRPDVPADIRPKTAVRPSKFLKKQAFGHRHATRRPRKNFGLKNFGLIFRSQTPPETRPLQYALQSSFKVQVKRLATGRSHPQ